jgi:hypothetical protein
LTGGRLDDHGHRQVSVQAILGSHFEVIEAKRFFELLMGLFANRAGPDGTDQPLDRSVSGQFGE